MFTTIGYSASQDSAVLIALAAIPDPHVRVSGNDVIVPTDLNKIIAVYPIGVSITRAQLVSPSLRRLLNPEIAPLDIATTPTTPFRWTDRKFSPITLDPEEALDAFAAEGGAGATRQSVFVWLSDGPVVPVTGDIRPVRVTATTTLAAFGWTNAAITFDQTLPAGRYQLVGMRWQSAGMIAARAVFVGYTWRPGVIGVTTDGGAERDDFRRGNMGIFGEFSHNTPPTMDFFSATADTSETGTFDLLKIA